MAFDSRGHGDSSVPAPPDAYEWEDFVFDFMELAEALCDRFGEPQIALGVGHSFGGSCLLAAAARDPARFGAVAFIDPVVIPPPSERAGPFMGFGEHPMAASARRRTAVFPSRDAIRASWTRRNVFVDWDPAVLDLYLRDGFRDLEDGRVELKCPPEVEAAVSQAGPRLDLFAEIPSLRTPALWLHAGRGNFALALVERAAALSDVIDLVSLDASHLMAMTDPDAIAERILAWSREISRDTARSAS